MKFLRAIFQELIHFLEIYRAYYRTEPKADDTDEERRILAMLRVLRDKEFRKKFRVDFRSEHGDNKEDIVIPLVPYGSSADE